MAQKIHPLVTRGLVTQTRTTSGEKNRCQGFDCTTLRA
ncbi:unnamed protein product [Heterotrigona itama]|uniref:Uncharacterized protein n=1 Tax=Heterotrigona itama TaxID=395501 RepID=A0A6V7GZT3_9HYME|nr:unnamed protein product [Heterotrigona itama]